MDEASVSPVLSDYTLHHSVYEKVHHGRHDLQTYNKPTYARLYGKVIRIGTPPSFQPVRHLSAQKFILTVRPRHSHKPHR